MPNPTVLSGMRQPRSVRLEEIRSVQPDNTVALPAAVAPGATTYVSKYRRYRVQVTVPQSYIGPDGRKNTGGKMIEAQFDEGVYRNDDRDPDVRKLVDETLQSNKYFGAFGSMAHFWLASDQQARTDARRIQAAMDTLKALPKDAVEQYVAELRQGEDEDHAMPPAEPQCSVRPIPPAAQ